jgi:hypothetical protein
MYLIASAQGADADHCSGFIYFFSQETEHRCTNHVHSRGDLPSLEHISRDGETWTFVVGLLYFTIFQGSNFGSLDFITARVLAIHFY